MREKLVNRKRKRMREHRKKHGRDKTRPCRENAKSVKQQFVAKSRATVATRGVISDLLQHITRQLPRSVSSLYPCNLQRAVSSHSSRFPPPWSPVIGYQHVHKDLHCYSAGMRQGNARRWELSLSMC